MKKYLVITMALILSILMVNISQAQLRNISAPTDGYWTISPFGGFNFPVGTFSDNYKVSGVAGLDVSYRVNRETAIFASFSFNFLRTIDPAGPKSSYTSYSIGPRYYFTHPQLKSSLFVEGAVGGYTFNADAYTINDPLVTGGTRQVNKINDTRVGVNAGLGADINLSSNFDIFVRSKYHVIFRTGGSSSFIGTDAGFKIRID